MDRAGATMASARVLDVMAVRGIVAEELALRASARNAYQAASTVTALRARVAEVVEAELARLGGKLGGLDDQAHAEIAQAVHRVADNLMHAPTARVQQLAGSAVGDSYETALRVLFDLGPGRSHL
jgi:glutamyl-tRNA reductase